MFALRKYQTDIIDECRAHMRAGVRSILVQAPTGSGKTALTANMIGTAASRGMTAWFTVHRRELVKQSIKAFAEQEVPHGVIAAGFYAQPFHQIQIGSIGTLARRHGKLPSPKLVIWDEAHHIAAGSWSAIHAALPKAFHIGLTATPQRLDGTGLSKWFQVMVRGPSVKQLIQDGYLSPYRLYAPSGVDLGGIHSRMGDYIRSELAIGMDKPAITGNAITHYKRLVDGKRAVVFCVSIEHSKHVVREFLAAGIPAEHVDGETDAAQRDYSIEKFARGEIKILSNVELFGEGFDLPAIEVAILLRPTMSIGLYLQQIGRALRPFPGKKEAVILDHAGNCQRHGMPDEDREWSLSDSGAGNNKRDNDASGSVRICPSCFAAANPGPPRCAFCGITFETKPRKVEHREGDLEEVTAVAPRSKVREQAGLQTFEELVALGKARHYKAPHAWAKHIMNARQAKKLKRGR